MGYSKEKRNNYLKKLKGIQGMSKAQIARIMGVSTKIIERAMKS